MKIGNDGVQTFDLHVTQNASYPFQVEFCWHHYYQNIKLDGLLVTVNATLLTLCYEVMGREIHVCVDLCVCGMALAMEGAG